MHGTKQTLRGTTQLAPEGAALFLNAEYAAIAEAQGCPAGLAYMRLAPNPHSLSIPLTGLFPSSPGTVPLYRYCPVLSRKKQSNLAFSFKKRHKSKAKQPDHGNAAALFLLFICIQTAGRSMAAGCFAHQGVSVPDLRCPVQTKRIRFHEIAQSFAEAVPHRNGKTAPGKKGT